MISQLFAKCPFGAKHAPNIAAAKVTILVVNSADSDLFHGLHPPNEALQIYRSHRPQVTAGILNCNYLVPDVVVSRSNDSCTMFWGTHGTWNIIFWTFRLINQSLNWYEWSVVSDVNNSLSMINAGKDHRTPYATLSG